MPTWPGRPEHQTRHGPRGTHIRPERQVHAAGKLFATRGYDATTMQDIVADADTSVGNVYFYFKNKHGLMRAVVESSFIAMFDVAEQRVARVPQGPGRVGALVAVNTTTFLTARREMLRRLSEDTREGVVQPALHSADVMSDRDTLTRPLPAPRWYRQHRHLVHGMRTTLVLRSRA